MLLGTRAPRLRSVPAAATYESGVEAVELAASAGVNLDGWQADALRDSAGERAEDNKWAATEFAIVVPRQDGKGEVLLARELAGLYLFGERLIIHTAHEFKTASEAFLRIKTVIDNCDDLRRKVRAIREANGEQGIELLNGNRLRFLARSGGSGRGFSGDLVILDEAYALLARQMGALRFTISARPNAQIWYASSAGHPDSEVLHSVRDRALRAVDAGEAGRLAYLEWSAPDDAENDDRQAWADANPALGIRIQEETIEAELEAAVTPELLTEFRRERLGIWETTEILAVIAAQTWAALADPTARFVEPTKPAFVVEVTPDHSASAIGACGAGPEGVALVDLVDHRGGTDWVVPRLVELRDRHEPCAIALDPRSPAAALIPALQAADVEFVEMQTKDALQACGAFYDACIDGTLRHLSQPGLNAAVGNARKRELTEGGWLWDRRRSGDVAPLVAVTYARWAWTVYGQKAQRSFWGAIG